MMPIHIRLNSIKETGLDAGAVTRVSLQVTVTFCLRPSRPIQACCSHKHRGLARKLERATSLSLTQLSVSLWFPNIRAEQGTVKIQMQSTGCQPLNHRTAQEKFHACDKTNLTCLSFLVTSQDASFLVSFPNSVIEVPK